jgi:hAT family C-terminal dimerisation region
VEPELIGNTRKQWLDNTALIAKHFDVIEWWKTTGKTTYPLIYPIAMCILSLPDSNGHQERTFSAATWMDGLLNNRQKEITYRMKVLLYKNEVFLNRYYDAIDPKLLEEAEKKTKELLKKHIGSQKESEIEEDIEHLMDMYNINGEE